MSLFAPWLLVVAFLKSLALCQFVFTETDLRVVQSLALHFRLGHCIFEREKGGDRIVAAIRKGAHPAKGELLTASLTFFDLFHLMNRETRYQPKTMIILKMSNESIWALEKLSMGGNVTSIFTWLLFSDTAYDPSLFRNIDIPFDCEFLFVHRKETYYSITELYQIAPTSRMEMYHYGNWTRMHGLSLVDLPLYRRRNSLKGHKFFAVVNNEPPYVSIQRDHRGVAVLKGYFYEIWRELEARLDFRTEFPAAYFTKSPSRVLRRRDAEFAVGKVSNFAKNNAYMDFTQPLIVARVYAFGHRRGGELDWDSYLKPFSTSIWYVNLIWMASSSFVLAIFYWLAWHLKTSERNAEYFIFTLSESILVVFRAICMQGSDVTPNSYSCRLIFLSIYVTALVVTSAYSAALFAILTVPKPKSHFNTLGELFNNRSYEIAFPSDPSFQRVLESFTDLLWTSPGTLKERIMESNFKLHLTAAQGLQRICEDKFLIFIYDMPNVLHLMTNMSRTCQRSIVPLDQPLFTDYIGFAFKKNSAYRKLINYHLTRLREEGILNRLSLHEWPPAIPNIRTRWSKATFSDVSPVFCLFFVGTFIGVLVVFLERFIRYLKRRRSERLDQFHPEHLDFYGYGY